MKLAPIANTIILSKLSNLILESADGDASSIQSQLQDLSAELKSDGEDITDEEVQAAMLNALVDANGDISQVDVDDVESARVLAKRLSEDKEFYYYCSDNSKKLYKELYTINAWKQKISL